MPDERAAALAALAVEIEACRACPLGSQRTQSVPGEGSPNAELLLVGEAPGAHEDAAGRPFVGAAGKLLDLLLNLIGLQRPLGMWQQRRVEGRPLRAVPAGAARAASWSSSDSR